MENSLDPQIGEIIGYLRKSFPNVWANCWADQTEFRCQLGPSIFNGVISFTIINNEIKEHNSYDVVNTIWEYIAKEIL